MFILALIIVAVGIGFILYFMGENKNLTKQNTRFLEHLNDERARRRKMVADLKMIAKSEPLVAHSALQNYLDTLK